jgi:hypothetical protein
MTQRLQNGELPNRLVIEVHSVHCGAIIIITVIIIIIIKCAARKRGCCKWWGNTRVSLSIDVPSKLRAQAAVALPRTSLSLTRRALLFCI